VTALVNIPIAHAAQAYWWASKQGLEGAHDRITAEISADSLRMIQRAHVSGRLTEAAMNSLCLMARRRGERRGAVG
jgi:hypothetical protein